ncbi:hypothetical protein [Candidatus Chlorohelix allophototropha]
MVGAHSDAPSFGGTNLMGLGAIVLWERAIAPDTPTLGYIM